MNFVQARSFESRIMPHADQKVESGKDNANKENAELPPALRLIPFLLPAQGQRLQLSLQPPVFFCPFGLGFSHDLPPLAWRELPQDRQRGSCRAFSTRPPPRSQRRPRRLSRFPKNRDRETKSIACLAPDRPPSIPGHAPPAAGSGRGFHGCRSRRLPARRPGSAGGRRRGRRRSPAPTPPWSR